MTRQSQNGNVEAILKSSKYVLILLISFAVSNAKIMSTLSPFGIALTASLPLGLSYVSFLGSLLGYIFLNGITQSFSYIIALIAILAVKMCWNSTLMHKRNIAAISVVSFLVSAATGGIDLFVSDFSVGGLFLKICEAFLSGSMTFFCATTFRTLGSKSSVKSAGIKDLSSGLVVLGIIILSLFQFQIGFLNVGRFLGLLMILSFMYSYGFSGGVLGGVIVALCAVLYNPELAPTTGILIVASFFGGVFKPLGKFGQLAVFVVTNATGTLI
ncbi:MAG: protein serine/threonine phosphatase, partial [Oscillospiraceae bacterium]|nr:protein serine/threonine phosphatase [Oscillospiraceae bacterium]